jgi:hypothetical protein
VGASVSVVAIVVGAVISIASLSSTRKREAEVRRIEAAKPFLELRQKLYMETAREVAILTNPNGHSPDEIQSAKRRFRELFVVELSMVEAQEVETQMEALAREIDPDLLEFTPAQDAAYELSHALRDTFVTSWGVRPRGISSLRLLRQRGAALIKGLRPSAVRPTPV